MVTLYTSIEFEKDCFEGQIVKTWKFKILGALDLRDQTIIILDHTWR